MPPPVHKPVVIQGDPGFVPVVHNRDMLPWWFALLTNGTGLSNALRDPITNAPVLGELLPVPFGQVRVGGTVLYVQGLGGDSLTYGQGVVAWCEGEIESIDAITGNGVGFSARSDDWVTIAVNQHHGESGGDTNPGNIFGKIQPSFAECAYTHFQITVPSYQYRWWWTYMPGGYGSDGNTSGAMDAVPWAADVHGLKLYDPRLDSTNGGTGSHRYSDPTTWAYSNNPILESRHVLMKYGHLLNAVDIDDANIAAMADASDAAGFTCNIVFAAKTLVRDALTAVLQTCNGQPIDSNGKAGFYLDIPNPGASVGTFSEEDGDIWGLKYEWLSARDRYTQYAVSFANKDANYKPDQTPIFGDPGTFSSEPTKTISSVDATTDTLTMASSPGWSVNDTVLFFQNGGVAIPGLSDGVTYVVKTISSAAVTLALVAGGTTIDLTGTPSITTQYLQRVGAAYPPTMVVKLLVIAAPGINTLPAAIILRDYLYNANAIKFRVSGTMNARGIGLQQGQKIHLTTLKGVDMDALLVQISGDQSGFFSFVVKPYSAGVYGSTPITQGPPIVTPTRPNDINVTDRTQTKQVLTSTDSTHDNYDVFQLVEYVLPLNYAATIDHLAVRGSEAAGAQSQVWSDLAASEISVSTAGNAAVTDSTHENLYHTAVRRATRVITYSTRPTVLTDVTTEKTTRVIVKSIGADGSASNGVTTDYTAGVGSSAPPTTPPPVGITSPLVIPPSGTASGLGGEIQLRELAAGGTNSTGFGAPDALAGDLRYVLPATGPSIDGQALVYDSAGAYAGRKATKWDLPYVEKLMIETPSGSWTGRTYVLSQLPLTAKILLIVDNMPLKGGFDYGRSGQTITLAYLANRPVSTLVAVYSYRAQVGSAVSSSETVPLSGTAATWVGKTIDAKVFRDVAFAPTLGSSGTFAAVVYDGYGGTTTDIYTSVDRGETWQAQTTPVGNNHWIRWNSTGGYFLCGSPSNYTNVMISTDAVTWTLHTITVVGAMTWFEPAAAVWAPALGLWLATGASGLGPRQATSPDGIAWTDRGSSYSGTALCWAEEIGVGVLMGQNTVVTTTDGLTWTPRTPPDTGTTFVAAAWSPDLGMLAACGIYGISTGKISTSSDGGATWSAPVTLIGPTSEYKSFVWSRSRLLFVAGGVSSTGITTTPDGTTWTPQATPGTSTYGWHLCAADSIDVIVGVTGDGTPRAMSSLA